MVIIIIMVVIIIIIMIIIKIVIIIIKIMIMMMMMIIIIIIIIIIIEIIIMICEVLLQWNLYITTSWKSKNIRLKSGAIGSYTQRWALCSNCPANAYVSVKRVEVVERT